MPAYRPNSSTGGRKLPATLTHHGHDVFEPRLQIANRLAHALDASITAPQVDTSIFESCEQPPSISSCISRAMVRRSDSISAWWCADGARN